MGGAGALARSEAPASASQSGRAVDLLPAVRLAWFAAALFATVPVLAQNAETTRGAPKGAHHLRLNPAVRAGRENLPRVGRPPKVVYNAGVVWVDDCSRTSVRPERAYQAFDCP